MAQGIEEKNIGVAHTSQRDVCGICYWATWQQEPSGAS